MPRQFERDTLNAMLQYFGREVALAYNVLNTTNYWSIALVGGLITALLGDAKYPTISEMFVVAVALVFLTRFFVRSCLGLMNMYRWNLLNQATLDVLGFPKAKEHNSLRLDAALNLYYYQFRSPVAKSKILWDSLKLAYFWLFAVLLTLFAWGWIKLTDDRWIWTITGGLVLALGIEGYWFSKTGMFKHAPMKEDLRHAREDPSSLEERLARLEECCNSVKQLLEQPPASVPPENKVD